MSSLDNYLNSLEAEDQKKQKLVGSISQAANTNPDEFARMVELSKASQISVDAIPDYKEQAVQAKVLGDAAIPKLFNQNPATADWLSNVDNAKIAHDQINELGLIENAGRKVGFFASGMTKDLVGGGIEGMGYIADAVWRRATSAAGKLLPTPMAGGQATEESLAGSDMPGTGFTYTGKKIGEFADQYIKPEGKMTKADQIASGLGQATGQIGMMFLPGGAVAAPLMMFGQGTKQQKDKIDMDKLSLQAPQSDKDWEVLTGGAITGATEWLVSKLMIKTPAAFALRSKMLDYSAKIALGAGEEGIQEMSENILQDAAHVAMTNPESTIKWNEAVESGEVGAWVGGIIQGVINGALHIRARGQQKSFENLNDAAGAQRLREREPSAYQNFADATAQHLAQTSEGAVTDVYVDANTFKQTMLDNNINPESIASALPSLGTQYNEALATDGDLVIPMNEWVGKVAGTDIGTLLSPHVRANADSLSMVETQQAYEMRTDIQKAAEAVIEKNKANEEFIKSAKEVETTMLDQLKATGRYTDAVAKVNAQFVRDFVVTQSADMGVSPMDFFDKYNYKVMSEGQAAYTQQNLEQATQILSATPEFKNWFKSSKASDETGKPIVLYHSTDADVTEFNTKGGKGKTAGTGLFLTNKPNISGSYAPRRGGMTYPVYASLQNPLIVDFGGANWNQAGEDAVVELQGGTQDRLLDYFNAGPDETVSTDDVARLARERGHDGVIIRNAVDQGPYNVVQGDNVGDIYVAFNPEQIKSVFNEGSWSPETANILKQSATLRSGKETLKKYGLDPEGTYKTREIAAALEARQRDKYGLIAGDERGTKAMNNIAKWMATEVEFEMENPEKSGVGWYSEKFQRAIDIMGEVYPELKTDKSARNLMTALIAITSDGQKVVPNFMQAMDIYGNFRKGGATEGQFTTNRGHQRQASIDNNLQVLQRLYDQMGPEQIHEYLMQEKTISDLKKIAKANGGEMKSDYQAHIKMPMAAVEFGPKLGAFYANLMGAHGYLTMDRWWSRSFNRYRGTLLQAPTQQGLDRFKELLGKPEMSNDEAIAATVEYRNSYEAKNYKNGTEIEKAANTIYKAAFENLEDAPFNAKDRTFMLDAVNKAQQLLAKKGYNLSVADIQAILWYYEKRLYGELGARQSADISYEEAAKRVATVYAGRSGELFVQDQPGESTEDGGATAAGVPVGEDIYQGADQSGILKQKQQVFYSALQRAFESAKQSSMPADQWAKWLTGNQSKLGVKKEEIEATGLREYLELNGKEKLTKEQITAFLSSNGVKIQEVMKGGGEQIDYSEAEELPVPSPLQLVENDDERLPQYKYAVKTVMDGRFVGYGNTEQDALSDAYSGYPEYWENMNPEEGTKYGQYTLPGGQNYKELLLTLPDNSVNKFDESKVEITRTRRSATQGSYTIKYDGKEIGTFADELGAANSYKGFSDAEIMQTAKNLYEKGSKYSDIKPMSGAYRSSHWDEVNILAHIRFNERTDADGKKVLFIEELQSDWAQAGRKGGFKSELSQDDQARVAELRSQRIELDRKWRESEDPAERRELMAQANEISNKVEEIEGPARGAVPDAPFVKDTKAWVGLAMKRMIRYAAENGFDKVAFVNGKQSAERYNLAKQIDYIEYEKTDTNEWFIKAMDHTGRAAVTEYGQTPEKLEALVGKEIAQKIVNDEGVREPGEPKTYGVLKNAELTVGGEGMKSFYDKIVPQVANDVLKKLGGGKVEPVTIGTPINTDMSITDMLSELNIPEQQWLDMPFEEKEKLMDDYAEKNKAKSSQQLGFTITPEMRDAALAGQALFQKENEGDARGGFDPSRLTTILNEKTDYSTFLHETAHFFLTVYSDMAAQPNATARAKADMQTLLDWFGVQDLATWNAMSLEEQRKYHEQFAYNYELYLFEGKAPSVKMQSLFDRFTAWLKRVYKSIREDLNAIYRQEHGEDLPILTGEVREVMDRMLASDEQIKQAEQVRSMAPIYQTQEQSGMDDGAWAAYKEMVKEAQTESINDLTKASLRQMKWLENARSRVIKDIQRTTRETRKKVMAEVTEEVDNLPMFKAQDALKAAENEAEQAAVIDAFGFSSVEELKLVLKNSKNKREIIRERTDKRMLEEYGDLTDPKQIEIAIERALHTEARARFVAVELRHLAKATQPVRVMLEAARQAARAIISNKPVGSIREKDFSASEARSARQAMEALRRGDSEAAAKAKQSQLLNNQLTAEALSAKAEVAKAMELFKKVFRKDEKLAKGRDMNLVSAARAILANYGLGNTDMGAAYYLEKVKAYDPEFYAEIEPMITAHKQAGKPVTDLTMDEFRDLAEQVEALWIMSRNSKTVEIDGKRMNREDVVNELVAAMPTTGKPRLGYDKAMSDWDKRKIMLMGARAALRRVESWVDAMDNGKMDGPFRKYIWTPVSEAVAKYRLAKVDYLQKYLDIVKTVEKGLTNEPIVAPEIGYTFKNKAELLHAIIHTGNNSNKRKLLLGREWASVDENENMDTSQWDSFIARMVTEGKLTKADYDFAQKVWDLLEEMKPAAQKAHKEMYGFYFAEITADAFDTPFGSYRGGYAPAVTDPWINTEASVRNEQETQQTDNSYMFPTTGRGFTKGRVEYNKPLILDLGFLPSHLDKVLRFTFIEPRVKDVAKIVKTNKVFASAMDQLDPTIRGDMLVPWLQRTAQQMIQMPMKGMGGKLAHKFFSEVRTRTGMQMMVANFTNAIQQITGISIAGLKVKPSYLRDATWLYVRQPTAMSDMISEKSEYMRGRLSNSQFEVAKSIDELLLNPSKYEKLRDFAGKHGYFMQQGMQNLVDTVVWTGAYNQAMAADPDEKAAVRAADSAVRLTQGSFAPEDQSRFESGNAFVRAFTMFYSYFNMQSNLLGTEFTKIVREFGVKKGMGKLLYVYVLGFMIPAVLSEMIVQAAGGFDDGDDDEYDMFDAMALFFGSQARAVGAMAPIVGPAVTAGVNMFNSKPYDDRISTSPSISAIEASVRAPASVYNAIAEDKSWKKAVRDVLTMLGMITGLPLGQLAKPAGYAADVAQGNISPESPLDVVRGLVSGKDVNRND